jgi:hypothetical protein|tara:strand:+ start:297 stop:917 length:621 start_codon:yes stop_codon:yes gene_type:complete
MSNRKEEKYKGAKLIAAFYNGEFQGQAWGPKLGSKLEQELAHEKGVSLDEVLAKLRSAVSSDRVQGLIKSDIIEKHSAFLKAKGITPETASAAVLEYLYSRKHRTPNCYNCSSNLDNEVDLECPYCNWIICTGCGACGCGHPVYGEQFSGKQRSTNLSGALRPTKSSPVLEFSTVEEARLYANENPGSKMMRDASGKGWIVEVHEQ